MDRSDHLVFLLEESRNSVRSLLLALSLSFSVTCGCPLDHTPCLFSSSSFVSVSHFLCSVRFAQALQQALSFSLSVCSVCLSQSTSLDRSAYIGNTLLLMHAHSCILSTSSLDIHNGGCPTVLLCVYGDLGAFKSAHDSFYSFHLMRKRKVIMPTTTTVEWGLIIMQIEVI